MCRTTHKDLVWGFGPSLNVTDGHLGLWTGMEQKVQTLWTVVQGAERNASASVTCPHAVTKSNLKTEGLI